MKLNKKILGVSLGIFILGGAIFFGVPILNGALNCDHSEESHSGYKTTDIGFTVVDEDNVNIKLKEMSDEQGNLKLIFDADVDGTLDIKLEDMEFNGHKYNDSVGGLVTGQMELPASLADTNICEYESLSGKFVISTLDGNSIERNFTITNE